MQKDNSLLSSRRFLPLFSIQSLNALNDNLLKNAILVMITYHGLSINGLSREISLNLATLSFILPFFIFSSYAGKFADAYSKVKMIRLIKVCEVGIVIIAAFGFIWHSLALMISSLVMIGIHSTFFSPIKYSILPQYFSERKALLLANGYIEFGTFVFVLLGQFLGSWYMANKEIYIVVALLAGSTLIGLILSYWMEEMPALGNHSKISWNILKDTLTLKKEILQDKIIRNNLRSISWFWALGVIYTTQLPVFTESYMGGSARVYSIMLALFSVSIGLGSIICAKISDGVIHRKYVLWGSGGVSFFSLILLALNFHPHQQFLDLAEFAGSLSGIVNFSMIFVVGLASGFYSVTCYNELQVIAPLKILSQVIAVNNIMNALAMICAAAACAILLFFISIWWLLFLAIMGNLVFLYWYWRENIKLVR